RAHLVHLCRRISPPPSPTLFPYTTLFRSDQDVSFPLGQLTTVTGVSGAGKSTLVTHVFGSVVQQSVTTTVTDEPTDSAPDTDRVDRKSTRLNSSHVSSSYAVFYLKQNIIK